MNEPEPNPKTFSTILVSLILILTISSSKILAQQIFEDWREQRRQEQKQFMEERDRQFKKFLEKRWKKMKQFRNENMYSEPKLPEMPQADSPPPGEPREVGDFNTTSQEDSRPDVKPETQSENEKNIQRQDEGLGDSTSEAEPPDKNQRIDSDQTDGTRPSPKGSGRASDKVRTRSDIDVQLSSDVSDSPKKNQQESAESEPDDRDRDLQNPVEKEYYRKQVRISRPEKIPTIGDYSDIHDLRDEVPKYWEEFQGTDKATLLRDIRHYKRELNLNGWHLLNFVYTTTGWVTDNQDNQALLTWGLMLEMGYDVRVGSMGDSMVLLYHTPRDIPGSVGLKYGGKNYYIFNKTEGKIWTYPKNFEGAKKPVHPEVSNLPDFPDNYRQKEFRFTFQGEQYEIPVQYHETLAEYMLETPRVYLGFYFEDYRPSGIKEGFLDQVEREMDGLSEWERLDFLLKLTQEVIEYKTDDELFGSEVWMVPPQFAHHAYGDCDDRAIFFGWLVQQLLDRNTVGTLFPGHLATAVEYDNPPRGEYVSVDGTKYILADPTYMGSAPGQVMPAYRKRNVDPKLLFPEENLEMKPHPESDKFRSQ